MKFCYESIGVIRSPHSDARQTPIQPVYASGIAGLVELDAEYEEGLDSIDGFSHIYLIYPFDRAEAGGLLVKPFLDDTPRGVFATRSPHRPNAIGMSLVRLSRREGRVLHVLDIDVLDGTPLLDIKPYVTRFDVRVDASSGWQDRIDEDTARARGTRAVTRAVDEENRR